MRKRYRITYTKEEGGVCSTMDIGVPDKEALYRAVKGMAGMEVDDLFDFEAHCILADGTVEVIKSNNPEPKIKGRHLALIIPKDIEPPAINVNPVPNQFKELCVPTMRYVVMSASTQAEDRKHE